VQSQQYHILHQEHHILHQEHHIQEEMDKEVQLTGANLKYQMTSDLPVALRVSIPMFGLFIPENLMLTMYNSSMSLRKIDWKNSIKKGIEKVPSISYFSVFFNAFIALDLSAKCTKPYLLFSCPALAGGRATLVIFP
jgi:hypothetical protein